MRFWIVNEKDGKTLEIIGAQSISIGRGLEMAGRYAFDASRSSQGVYRRQRETAATATLNATFSAQICAQNGFSIFDHVSAWADIIGARVRVFWASNDMGVFVLRSVQFSADIDPHSGFDVVSVGVALVEARVYNPQPATVEDRAVVRTL